MVIPSDYPHSILVISLIQPLMPQTGKVVGWELVYRIG